MNCSHDNLLSVTERRAETEILSDHIEELRNMKQVQTTSTTNVGPIKLKLNKRSYSDEELGNYSRRYKQNELKEEILEDKNVYDERLKVKLLREKMQKLVEKMKKPGEEKRLRIKIEKYLKRIQSQSDCGTDHIEFKRQLPNNIIRSLKNMYTKSEESMLTRMESSKLYSSIKRAVMDWLVTIPIKRQDFLGRTIRRDDILKYLTDTLKSIIINRPNSDIDYKNVLKSTITNVMESLPIISDNFNNNCKLADDLASDILNISTKFPNRHVQPTVQELKEFIADEIAYFIEESYITINTKRLKYLEAELTDALMVINDIDDTIIADDLSDIFRDIGNLPVYKARYMTDIILNDYKDYFYQNDNKYVEEIPPRVYSVYQTTTSIPSYNDRSCIGQLIDEIYDWVHDLPVDLYMTKSLKKQYILDLVEKISRGLSIGDPDVIDKEVNIWTEKVFKGKLHKHIERQLTDRLRNVLYEDIEVETDPKHERLVIRRYEDIIDEWIDKALIKKSKESSFLNIRNECIHDLAKNLYNKKLQLNKSNEIITRKLQDEILGWINKLPLHLINTHADIFAAKLVENIQACETTDMKDLEATARIDMSQLEEALLEWLMKLPLYKNKSSKNKEIMDLIMTKLADKLYSSTKDSNLDPNVEILKYVRMLDTNQNDEFVQNTALKLKRHLQKLNFFENLVHHENPEDEFLVANINIWMKYLPFDARLVKNYESRKVAFIEMVKGLRFWGASEDVQKEEIISFLRSLPLKNKSQHFLNEEATRFIQNLALLSIENVPRILTYKSDDIVGCTVRDWCKKLPFTSEYNPRELQYGIENMTALIVKLTSSPQYSFNYVNLRKEILENLKTFPLKPTYNSQNEMSQLANELIEMLKEKRRKLKSVAVYGMSLKKNITVDTDYGIQSIKDIDMKSNLDIYAKQLVDQINEWLNNLGVADTKEQDFKEVVINDLAGDIIDRLKYLELNPASRGTNEEELEHLKYQIFKWINKLVGEENLVTIEHASDLMNRIQSVPVPILVKPHGNPPNIGSGTSIGTFKEQRQTSRRLSSQGDLGLATGPNSVSKSSQNGILRQTVSNPDKSGAKSTNTVPQNPANTLPKVYDKYQKIFNEKSNEIVNAAIPNDKSLADMAKTGIYKSILNSFFTLKSNPEVENDYACFEFMLEDKIDELIDLLPQTTELDRIKHNWKISVLINAVDMLKEMHIVTDRPTFRQRLAKRLNRQALKDLEDKECYGLQQAFLMEMANDYILETSYKQDDPIKSNIYKQRLMNKLDEFVNHVTKEHKLGFKYINRVALKRRAMKVLDEVPIPAHDILHEEVEEILLAEEIQKWYKELPTNPYLNYMDLLLRKRLIEILAKKLNEIDKNMPRDDPSKERLIKHEMTMFLERKGRLQPDQDLNINFMVDELNNRLKNRWIDKPVEYEEFNENKPVSSTFARFDNDEVLPPVEAPRGSDTAHTQSVSMQNDHRSYGNSDKVENGTQKCALTCPSRNATGYPNPANANEMRSPQNIGGHSSRWAEVNKPEHQSYNRHQDNVGRYSEAKGYTAKRKEIHSAEEDERGEVRCRCKLRRYVCYDREENYMRYVPCRYVPCPYF